MACGRSVPFEPTFLVSSSIDPHCDDSQLCHPAHVDLPHRTWTIASPLASTMAGHATTDCSRRSCFLGGKFLTHERAPVPSIKRVALVLGMAMFRVARPWIGVAHATTGDPEVHVALSGTAPNRFADHSFDTDNPCAPECESVTH